MFRADQAALEREVACHDDDADVARTMDGAPGMEPARSDPVLPGPDLAEQGQPRLLEQHYALDLDRAPVFHALGRVHHPFRP
jgi:hypothetical protein